MVESYRQEVAEFLGAWQAEELREEVGRFLPISRGDDGVVERDSHINPG
jgi:hypothetical protein